MLVGTVELKISIVDKFLLVPIEPKAYYSPSIMNIIKLSLSWLLKDHYRKKSFLLCL